MDKQLIKSYEEKLKNAATLEELQRVWQEIELQLADGEKTKLYKVKQKRELELKLQQFHQLKNELYKKGKKNIAKAKADIRVHVTKKWINSRLFSAEHYVMILTDIKDVTTAILKKAKLVERQGYWMLEIKGKNWVLNSEPILLQKSKFPFGKKYVALYAVLPTHPYTLDIKISDDVKKLVITQISGTHIVHALVKTRFFEALARVGGGFDLMTLIIGIIAGLGIGLAIGFGASYFHLTNTLQHTANATVVHTVTTTTAPSGTYTVPPIVVGGQSA